MLKSRIIFILLLAQIITVLSCKNDESEFDASTLPEASEIPYFVINSFGKRIINEPKVAGSLEVFVNEQSVFSNPLGIEIRGSSSQRIFPKLSYGIEFWNGRGDDVSIEILGLTKEEDWILNGPYSDKTHLRNVLLFDLSNAIGRWAPKTRFAELHLNGAYRGAYVFMEKIKQGSGRLDIEPMGTSVTTGAELTGGYILKIDKTSGDIGNDEDNVAAYSEAFGFRSKYSPNESIHSFEPYGTKRGIETYFLYEYPRAELINSAQKNYVQQYINDFEDALVEEDFSDDSRMYENYIDVNSFVDFFILNELSANPDAYRLSTYLHKRQNGKLAMGPAWDFNLAFGNDARSTTDTWMYQYNNGNPNNLWLVHFWWGKLLEDSKFRQAIKRRWGALRANELSQIVIETKIDDWITYLASNGVIDRNFTRWPVLGEKLPFNNFVGNSYEEEIDYVKDWIQQRATWMDSEIQGW